MNEESAITNGLIISLFADVGPENIYNSSPLDESDAFNHTIKNFSTLSVDVPETFDEIRSFGPIPTPHKPYTSLAFVFLLKAEESEDPRVALYGRIIVFWIISRSNAIKEYTGVLKQMLRRTLRFYNITKDIDLFKQDIMEKMDAKLKIVASQMEAYYISDEDSFESFSNLLLIPPKAPIVLVDSSNKQIRVLLRDETSSLRKAKLRQILNTYIKQIPQGPTFKVEFIVEPYTIQIWLSKAGFEPQKSTDTSFKLPIFDQVTFEELDEFFDTHLTPIRHELIKKILHSIENDSPLQLRELAKQTGVSEDLIEQILTNAITRGIIPNASVKNGFFIAQKQKKESN
ncbi:MAG: hypothetical protein ACFFCQ_07000 [Promethearchaeota archaeon]